MVLQVCKSPKEIYKGTLNILLDRSRLLVYGMENPMLLHVTNEEVFEQDFRHMPRGESYSMRKLGDG